MTGKVDTLPTSTDVLRIRPATLEVIPQIAERLLESDLREIVDGTGLNPVLSMSHSILNSEAIAFYFNDECGGIAGTSSDGCIWMHCTDTVRKYPILFCKEARKWVDSLPHKLLYNYADIRNTLHLKLLKSMGFKFLRLVPLGPNNLYFVEFVKLC